VTPQERLEAALEEALAAIRDGALRQEPASDDFATVDEACLALGIRAKKHREKALARKAKGRGYIRRDGNALVIERKGLMQHVRSMRVL
jgi:hypothetical protein